MFYNYTIFRLMRCLQCEPESYDFILLDKTLSKLSTGLKHYSK